MIIRLFFIIILMLI